MLYKTSPSWRHQPSVSGFGEKVCRISQMANIVWTPKEELSYIICLIPRGFPPCSLKADHYVRDILPVTLRYQIIRFPRYI